jgi:hypothetical protein
LNNRRTPSSFLPESISVSELTTTTRNPTDLRGLFTELKASGLLLGSPEGQNWLQRIEFALAAAPSNLGVSQIMNPAAMQAYSDFGKFVCTGGVTIPDHLRGNAADCAAIAMQADRWGLDFYQLAGKTHVINGKLGYEAQLVGAVMVSMGAIKAAPRDRYLGDWSKILGKFQERESKTQKDKHGNPSTYKVPAWKASDEEGLGIVISATLVGEDEPREVEVFMTQALTRNSTLWTTNPKQQIYYLAEKLFARKYCPGVLLGVNTVDDLDSIRSVPKDMGRAEEVAVPPLDQQVLADWKAASEKGKKAATDFWLKLDTKIRKQSTQQQRDAMWAIAVAADSARTVDNAASDAPPVQAAAPADASPAAAGDATTANPETDDFVAEMERVEREQGSQ